MSLSRNINSLSKGWKKAYIMHKDRRVASIREDGSCTIYYPSFMPYNLWLEKVEGNDLDSRVSNLSNFYYWCASRVLTLDRKYAKEIFNAIGAKQAATDKDRAQIAVSYHALCLTDVYWVKMDKEKISFEDISLYKHSLSDAFADVSLSGKNLTVHNEELLVDNDVAGDVSTCGVAPKAWIRKNDTFYLLKNGDERAVNAELLASHIADCFSFDHVEYSSAVFDGKKVSQSKIITGEDYSIVPIEYVDIYCINHDIDREEFVLDMDACSFYTMNIMDYLVGNSDRHWGNWGFIVDNSNNKMLRLYPLMDFNKAFTDYSTTEGGICQTTKVRVSQKEAAIEAVKEIGLHIPEGLENIRFPDASIRDMFFRRLSILKSQTGR